MLIHNNFIGGNIKVVSQKGNDVYLENELRDTTTDWFYWAFCVEGAQNLVLTFHMQPNRLGYFGPAVSYDLKTWKWLDKVDGNSFSYAFGENESNVYFAHSMLYHPDRFIAFAKNIGLKVNELCKSQKGRSVPYVQFGEGEKTIILTSRHHACESTGSYVLEGVLTNLVKNPISGYRVLCVPFVDYDGVVDGDQGKNRAPWDHNRDYKCGNQPIYPTTAKIREWENVYGCTYGFDFHAPWHIGNQNDTVFIVQNSFKKEDKLNAFGKILEQEISENSFKYFHKNDFPFKMGWNQGGNGFSYFMTNRDENELAFTLETSYFGTADNVFTQDKAIELGKCFASAIRKYVKSRDESQR